MEEVPRRTSLVPLACPCFVLRLIGAETEGLVDYQDQDVGKGRVSLRGGGSLLDHFGGFDAFGGSGKHLALPLLVLQNTVPRGSHDGFDGFGGCGGFGHDGYPP